MKAIITGSTGLIGKALAKNLLDNGIEVLCLGRRELKASEIKEIFGRTINYQKLSMEDISTLPRMLDTLKWHQTKDCIFYHFAWKGVEKLTDGNFSDQLANAVYTANAVKAAKMAGCNKFINCGTLEETYLDQYLKKKENGPLPSTQINYSLAKIASRDMAKIVAYLEKIDYVHTRLSAPIDPELKMGSYIASILLKIRKYEPYEAPVNKKLFDFISVNDVANAYRLIGQYGKNKADYFIGTGKPMTLEYFFDSFKNLITESPKHLSFKQPISDDNFFSIVELNEDTGFTANDFLQIIEQNKDYQII